MSGRLRAVFFDLWGTLIVDDPLTSAERQRFRLARVRETLATLGIDRPEEEIETAFAAAGAEHELLHQQERDLSARGRTVAYVRQIDDALPAGLDDAAWRRLDDAILAPALQYPPAAMPGARDALMAVRALGIGTGLISNTGVTPGSILREILGRMRLLELLDVTVFSDEAQLAKPAAAIFEGAAAEIGVEAGAVAFVGDQPRLDVLGARRAGMWAVQIGDVAEDGTPEPHARIAALGELVPALQAMGLV
ncbi:MAG TPA: HAD family hydrolase [Dehalococcoidia bacterium]|nr:HAD family hydrolase [Dehalococcoidia bacterium]